MTTLIQGGWVIGSNGMEHRLVENGVVVFDDKQILHVGKSYSGQVDEKIDASEKIVAPGFINTHCHMQTPINSEAINIDGDCRLTFGNPNIPFLPTKDKLDNKSLSDDQFKTVATFALCALLKSGCTTIVEMGAGRVSLVELVGQLGLKAYLGPGFRSAETYTGNDGTYYHKDWNEERGFKGLEKAKAFVEKYDGSYNGRVKGLLIPMQVDNCTPGLLQEIRKTANEMKTVRIGIHAGQRIFEFQEILRKYKNTPIGFLNDIGFLGSDVLIGHALMVSGHSWTAYSGENDVETLARTGTNVAHCPLVAARTSCPLQSFSRYLRAGVNMTIGTDTWPLDIISEMRWASIIGKLIEGNRAAASSLEVFNAATLNAAKALGRNDLGRLVKGAKADIIILNVTNFRYAPIADPIKSLVNAGICDDVETVIIDGQKLIEEKKILGVDENAVINAARKVAKDAWAKIPEWDWAQRSMYDIGPMSLKPLEE